jgi:pyruvate/oxaloacetate carboxyltransferase
LLKDVFRRIKPAPRMEAVSRGAVEFIDLTLRDGQQSLLATRMSTSQVLRLLAPILDSGISLLEVWGGATLDSAMRFLNESPFERLMKMSEAAAPYNAGLRALSRGQNLFGYDPYPDDIVREFNREAVRAGVTVMRIFDALNYTPNFKAALDGVNEAGGIFDAAVCYTTGEPYDVNHFVKKALELEAMGAHMVSDKDMAGLKAPLDAWNYYRALKQNLRVPVVSHTHCTPGYGHISAVIALLAGIDKIDTAFLPLAGGASHPSIEVLSVFAELLGIETGLDLSDNVLQPVHSGLRQVAEEIGAEFGIKIHQSVWPGRDRIIPLAEETIAFLAGGKIDKALETVHRLESMCGFPPPNMEVLKAQIPGGMYSNFVNQLARDNKSEYLDRALEAVQEVRQMAGWCPLVTPTSQIVGVKAYFTAMGKTANPVQYVNLIAGYYGKTPFPIDPAYRKQVCGFSDEREYDSSGFSRDIPKAQGTDLPLAATPHEKLLYYLFPDSSGKAYLEGLRQKEWATAENRRREEHDRRQEAERDELKKNSLMSRYSNDMDVLSEKLSGAVSEGELPKA